MNRPSPNLATLLGIVGIAVLCSLLAGCKNEIRGGTSHESSGRLVVTAGDLRIETDRQFVATTQPSVSGTGKLSLDGFAAELKPTVEKFKNGWKLGIGFLIAAGFVAYFLRRFVSAFVLGALGVVAILAPAYLLGLAIAGVLVVLWANWKTIRELISGNQAAFEMLKPEEIEDIKAIMAKRQSSATRSAVRAAK
jgi:hypothetical protein